MMRNILRVFLAGLAVLTIVAVHAAGQGAGDTATQPTSGYVLGPDDQIVIRSIDVPEIPDKPIPIGTNGDVTLPLIGRVKAGGLTVEQLETELNTLFKTYVKDPQVSVTVAEFESKPVSVIGAVNKPGVIQLRGQKTLYEVLSMAGGPRDTAGSVLTITRTLENGEIPLPGAATDPSGRFSCAELNVEEILDGKNPGANIEIKSEDVIFVSQANSNMIYVVGDVEHAGAFTLGERSSVSILMALSLAGGLGRTAKPEEARIVRNIPGQSKPQEILVNLKKVLSGKAEDIGLQPQDVLVVPTSSRKAFATSFLPNALAVAAQAAIYRF
jgi:polysaccharide export outer membrane protein